ncbi:hypothetical protein C5E01_04915 [Rathayibacter iranicus]|nr:hypothetical protein C5E01_04915 [Rathayibacter iranicus]
MNMGPYEFLPIQLLLGGNGAIYDSPDWGLMVQHRDMISWGNPVVVRLSPRVTKACPPQLASPTLPLASSD